MRSLFISDLHLTPGRPDITRAFLRFLEQDAPQADTLYILGDFFEYWIGDDVMDDFHQQIAAALKTLANTGVNIQLMHGNRDFLIGERFCRQAGCQLLDDPSLAKLGKNQESVLLMHGDSLCTSDSSYMRYRRVIRNPLIKWLLLALPAGYRRKIARKLRANSMAVQKPRDILDVTPAAVTSTMSAQKVKTLIHGHTHRAAIHTLDNQCQRIVLGDWDKLGWSLSHDDEQGFQLSSFPIA